MAASAVFSVVVQKYENILQINEATGTKVISGLNSSMKQQIIQVLRQMKSWLLEEESKQGGADAAAVSKAVSIAYELEDVVDTCLLQELGRSSAYFTLKSKRSGSGIFILVYVYIRRIIHSVKSFVKATDDGRLLESNLKKIPSRISEFISSLPPLPPPPPGTMRHLLPPPDDHTAGIPSHLMCCLLYLGMFPTEMNIPVRRLIRLWIAEGFVIKQQSQGQSSGDGDDQTCLEDLAMKYIEDLERRGLIICKSSHKTCRLGNRELYDKFSLQAQGVSLFHIHKANTTRTTTSIPHQLAVRRVVEYANIKDYSQFDNVKSLQSYVSFNFQKKDTEAAQIGEFVRRITVKRGYSLLKVLDLERVYKPALPDEVGNLYNLRYLGLRWTFLDTLPSSVENLTLLQTLDLKHTYIKEKDLPIQLHKMTQLRHLYLNDIPLQKVQSLTNLTNCMQTLSGLFVDKKEKVQGINQLSNLKKLGLTCKSSCTQELGSWISSKLTGLRSLKLTCQADDDLTGKTSSLDLQSLVSLEKLTNIYLIGKIPKLERNRFEFPHNLRVLTLSFSSLEEDPMPTLGQLPNLAVLGLFASSYTGTRLLSAQDGFGSLLVLKLWGLKNLEEWMVGQGAMKNLQKLEIRLCDKLEGIPTRLVNSTAFEELTLTHMPKNMVADVKDYNKRKTRSSRQTHPWKLEVNP